MRRNRTKEGGTERRKNKTEISSGISITMAAPPIPTREGGDF